MQPAINIYLTLKVGALPATGRGATLMNTIRSIGPVAFLVVILAAAGVQAGTMSNQAPTTPSAAQAPALVEPPPTLLVDAPGEVEISIQIQPTEHSSELRLVADSGSYYRSTSIGLRGIDSEPLHTFIWRGFPVGDYEIVGLLLDDHGQEEVVVQAAMRVIGR